MATVSDLAARVRGGERRALSRLITLVENDEPAGRAALREIYRQAGRAHVVGVTGSPGTGKSTLVRGLAREYRRRDRTVGIVAVDPTSPFTGGAILGDRIRMSDLAGDSGIFVRSMATRGALGGLARATADVVTVLDAAGLDVVVVETVGVGQDEVDVARTAQTTLVVSVPGLGDDIQAIKAGILEIADVHVVNKADKEGANRLVAELQMMLGLAHGRDPEWQPPIVKTVASQEEGIAELVEAIERHRAYLERSGRLAQQRLEMARRQVLAIAREELMRRLIHLGQVDGELTTAVEQVAAHQLDPYTAAERLLQGLSDDRRPTIDDR